MQIIYQFILIQLFENTSVPWKVYEPFCHDLEGVRTDISNHALWRLKIVVVDTYTTCGAKRCQRGCMTPKTGLYGCLWLYGWRMWGVFAVLTASAVACFGWLQVPWLVFGGVGMIVRLRKPSYVRSDSLKYVQWDLVVWEYYRGCMRLKRGRGGRRNWRWWGFSSWVGNMGSFSFRWLKWVVFSSYPCRGMGTIVWNLEIVCFHGAGGYSDNIITMFPFRGTSNNIGVRVRA